MNEIEKLFKEGKFISAINLCENCKTSNLDDKIFFENKKNTIKKFYKEFIDNKPGETFLPLVDVQKNDGIIQKIKVTDSYSSDIKIIDDWNKHINLSIELIESYLKEEFPELLILEWDLSELKCGIKTFSFMDNNFHLEGDSYKLPLVLSIISFITGKEISNEYCFTGDIERVDNKFILKKVEGIEQKFKTIKNEFPDVKYFIYPDDDNKELNTIIAKIFNESIKKIYKSKFVKRYILLEKRLASSEFGEHKVVSFQPTNISIKINEFAKINLFIRNNLMLFKDEGNGVIIDGRAPISVYTMIFSFPEIINSLPNFLAVNYPSYKEADKNTAIVIRTSNSGVSKLKPGEYFFFKIREC